VNEQVTCQQNGTGPARGRSRSHSQSFGNAGAELLARLRPGKVLVLLMILVGFSIVAPGTVQAASPVVTLAPLSFTFAAQTVGTQSAAQTLTVTNTGTVDLQLVSGTFTGSNTNDFSFTTNCPFSLAVGASCTASITFTPSAAGTRTATFLATDNAVDSPQSISLSGTGTVTTAPAVTLSASSLTFANQAVNTTSAAQGVTLTNTGTAALTISSVAASAPFAQTNTCPLSPSTLAANALRLRNENTGTGYRRRRRR